MTSVKQIIILFTVAFIILAFDYGTKEVAFREVASGESRVLIEGFLWTTPRLNRGAAFSFLAGTTHSNWILLGITILLVPLLLWMYLTRYPKAPGWAFGLIIGGAVGNAVDRVLAHAVRDFIDLQWWPTFNIADAAIAVGVASLIIWSLFFPKKKRKRSSSGHPM